MEIGKFLWQNLGSAEECTLRRTDKVACGKSVQLARHHSYICGRGDIVLFQGLGQKDETVESIRLITLECISHGLILGFAVNRRRPEMNYPVYRTRRFHFFDQSLVVGCLVPSD